MLTRRNFDRALKRLSTSGLGRMRTLTIRPDRIDAQLLTKGGSLRSVQIRYDEPDINAFGTSGAGFGHLETIPFAKIDAGAPARLARSAAGRARLPVSQVDYVTLNSFDNKAVVGGVHEGRQDLPRELAGQDHAPHLLDTLRRGARAPTVRGVCHDTSTHLTSAPRLHRQAPGPRPRACPATVFLTTMWRTL